MERRRSITLDEVASTCQFEIPAHLKKHLYEKGPQIMQFSLHFIKSRLGEESTLLKKMQREGIEEAIKEFEPFVFAEPWEEPKEDTTDLYEYYR